MGGDPVPWDRWLEVLSSSNEGIYSEEDFEWAVAGLLPCPLSMFVLQYNKTGVLQVIFSPRCYSMDEYRKFEYSRMLKIHPMLSVWTGLCNLCYSPVSRQYRAGLEHQEVDYSLALPDEVHSYLVTRCSGGWGQNPICHICRETKVYLHIVIKEHCAVDLNPYGQVWLDWILRFYDAAEQYTSPSLSKDLDWLTALPHSHHDPYEESGIDEMRRPYP